MLCRSADMLPAAHRVLGADILLDEQQQVLMLVSEVSNEQASCMVQ